MPHLIYRRISIAVMVMGALLLAGAVALRTAAAFPAPTSYEPGHKIAIHIIPDSSGISLYGFAENLDGLGTQARAQLTSYEPGHTSYEPGHTDCDADGNACAYTFQDLPILSPGTSSPLLTLVITTTAGVSDTQTLAASDFRSQYVAGDEPVELLSEDNSVHLYLSAGTLQSDSYVVIMPTVGPPGDPPAGHRLISRAYSLRPSGGQEQVTQDMGLCIDYVSSLLGETPVQTLSIFRWDPPAAQWRDIASEPLGDLATHCQNIRQFGTYALMAGTTWRDSFQDYSGLVEHPGVQVVYGGRLALRSNASAGRVTSLPIAPGESLGAWGRIAYTAEITTGTALTISVLDGRTGEVLLPDTASGADLSGINPGAHPVLQLGAELSTRQAGISPYLDAWELSWDPGAAPVRRLFLPLLLHGAPSSSISRGAAVDVRLALSPDSGYGCDPPARPPITWTAPSALTQGTAMNITPDLAVDQENRIHAVWQQANGPVFYSTKEADAQAWSTPVSVSGASAGAYPHIATDPQGTAHVIWQEGGAIRYVAKPHDGTWSTPVDLSLTGHASYSSALYVDAVGNLHAAWADSSPGNNEIFYAYRDHNASAWSAPQRVSNTSGSSWAPTLVVDGQGEVHCAWYDNTPGVTEIYYTYKAPGTTGWDAAANVSNTAGSSQWPALVVDAEDGLHLVWQDTLPLAGLGQALILYYANKPAGGSWSQPLELTRDLANGQKAQPPALAISPSGELHAAWATMTDYRLRYAIKPDAETGWSVPQVIASLISPPNPANQWYFISASADFDRGIHLLWNDMAGSATFNQDIKYAAALPPPIPVDHALVLDESGRAVSGACIYRNGHLAGTTDDLGVFALDALTIGENLVAVKPLAEQPAARRGGWAYRTALTSMTLSATGEAQGHSIASAGRQRLTVSSDWPLIYFNLIVSIQWNATPEYVQEVASALQQASEYLYDVSDGQMAVGQVAVYDNAQHWEDADIQILVRNNVRPYAYLGGITSGDLAQTIRVGRHWNGESGDRGGWDEPNGFRTLIHEFGHYALHLWDSYFEYDPLRPGGINMTTGCTMVDASDYLTTTDPINATIMDYQYRTSELSARDVTGLWTPNCLGTAQWQKNGESDWETLLQHYSDAAEPPRWQLIGPRERGQVLAGPSVLPAALLALPQVETYDSGPAAPPRQVTVLGLDGQPYPQGALVFLDTQREGDTITLDQGLTAGPSDGGTPVGQITVYGATAGNTIRAISIDGSLSARHSVGGDTTYTLSLRGSSGLAATVAPVNPYASLIPYGEGRDLLLSVGGVGADGVLAALLVPPSGGAGQTVVLSYSPSSSVYTGTASMTTPETGLGSVHVRGLGGLGQAVSLDDDFHLAEIDGARDQDFYTPDGAAWLHLMASSFTSDQLAIILMPTGAVPQPLPAGMRALGNAYSIRVSGTNALDEHQAVLRLFYEPGDLAGATPAELRIARWDSGAWQVLGGLPDPERFSVAVQTSLLGIYVLLAPAEEGAARRAYLPLLLR